ncbi:hypothetical protein DIZ81_00475 [Legionella taurinensis]|uniref:Uncharacterized protein n=1 Tax=Legionella taurinensis TaxID=70611 RepID=A0A3A5LJI8_9GAMM|nr:hypothetical protein [Legionella taurinensis]MDX1836650.1 hypothetical protein [Legionella taurinensis]PUT42894.1 hypothetical protein DB744_00480 [Legionella taurinensis]PUT45449.1 hypothetical protein DB746_00480 [Legionella taurinensis]PUT46976.1 hypothetical protein DB743_03520 [Legionella taurinensis]PUT49216.1 hypothetical protein DB745_00480 [Legionella taurinensis]
MFNALYHHFLAKQQQFNSDYQNATLEEVGKATKGILASQNAETLNQFHYDEAKQREHQIVRLLLNDLYCRKMPPAENEVDLEKWEGLEQDYTYLEERLLSTQVYFVGREDQKDDDYLEVVEDEVKNLDDYIRKTGLEGDIEPFIAEDPTRGEMGDFLRLMAAVKQNHLSAALVHSNYRVGHLERTYATLTEQFELKHGQLAHLMSQYDELKTQRENLEKSNTWVYKWGIQAACQQANRFQRLVLWAFNFFTSEPIQDSARRLQGEIGKAYTDTTEVSKKISSLGSEVNKLNQRCKEKGDDLNHAKKRQVEIAKIITPTGEAGAMLEETIPERPDDTLSSFRI